MAWRVLPNTHTGDCAFRSAAQLLGWQGDDYTRLRRECADDVRKMSTEELTFAAYTYGAAYEEPRTRHEVRWMAPFAGREMNDALVDGDFREALATAIETPGNVFWGDHFTLELISNRYKILFLTVRSTTNNITIMPSRFSDRFNGDLTGVQMGFLLAQGTTAFDAICYTSARTGNCISSITQQDLEQHPELADVVYSVMSRPKSDVRFPLSIHRLLSQPRFVRSDDAAVLNDLATRMAAVEVQPKVTEAEIKPKAPKEPKEPKELEQATSSVVNRVRNPETKRSIVVNGPTWRKHRAMYGDRVFTYEVC